MDKIIQFKKVNQEKIKKQYELDDYSEDLVELAEKLIQCNPGRNAGKKKEAVKAGYLKKAEEYRNAFQQTRELSDEDLDAAAGGVSRPEDVEDPFKDNN